MRIAGSGMKALADAPKHLEKQVFATLNKMNNKPFTEKVKTQKPVVLLTPNDKIITAHKKAMLAGASHNARYPKIHETDQSKLQPVYTTGHTFSHTFTITELTHNDFLKRLSLIERQMNKKFGSTYNLRLVKTLPQYHKRFTFLKSPFKYKKAQVHYKYVSNSYELLVSYAFNLTDPLINDYVFNVLKKLIMNTGGVKKFGYQIENRRKTAIKFPFMVPNADNSLTQESSLKMFDNLDIHVVKSQHKPTQSFTQTTPVTHPDDLAKLNKSYATPREIVGLVNEYRTEAINALNHLEKDDLDNEIFENPNYDSDVEMHSKPGISTRFDDQREHAAEALAKSRNIQVSEEINLDKLFN